MKRVILISGKMRSGKNQFAEYLCENLKSKCLSVSTDLFAKSLKDGCKEDFKKLANVLSNIANEIKSKIGSFYDRYSTIDISELEKTINKLNISDDNWYEDKTDITRNLLQLYGTEIFRKRVDDNWWVNQVRNRCINSDSDYVIVTDCRFPNEIEQMYCKDYETFAIRIERNINTQELMASHDSETSLDNWKEWDYIIENNGTLDNLKESAELLVEDLTTEKTEKMNGLFTRI